MRYPLLTLCLSAALALPMSFAVADVINEPATQTSTKNAPEDLFQMRLATQRSIANFYMFNGQDENQDQLYAQVANKNATQALNHLNSLTVPSDPHAQAVLVELQHEMSTYITQLNYLIAATIEQGYTDLQPVADLALLNSKILKDAQEVEQLINQEKNYTLPDLTKLAREQSLLMQSIATDYAARSASVGASFFADGEKQPLDQLSQQFADNLLRLGNDTKNTAQTSKSLRAIQVKWRYIERSLKNYNEDSVPFVIDRNASSITQSLEQLAADYALLGI